MLNLALIGLNYRTAEVATRERAAFPAAGLPDALRALAGLPGIAEAFILSTCNRVEILCGVEDRSAGVESLETFLSESSGIARPQLQQRLYRHLDEQAVRHVFRVASSLDSMIVGEPQILGQLKAAYTAAVEARTAGAYLNNLMQTSFRVAKRVRSETSIGEYSVSVSSAAVELARKILGDLRSRSILIVGAGKMGELAVRHLASGGACRIRVANRSAEAARALAARFGGEDVPFGELPAWMALSDIVITSTGAREVLVTAAMAKSIAGTRSEPLIFIDISVPRNVDPAVASVDNIFCYDIDDLGAVVQANLQERRRESAGAEKIIEQETGAFCERLKTLDLGPVVSVVQQRIQDICRTELERFLRKTGPHDSKETQELESMISRIAGKIAHPLVTQLRTAHHDPGHQAAYLATIKRIFHIQE